MDAKFMAASAMLCGGLLAASPASAGQYVYTQVQAGGQPFACAVGINDSNHVVGEYYGSGSAPFGGYVYYPGSSAFTFGPPAGTDILDSCAYVFGVSGINAHNLAVATYANSVKHSFGPFTWSPATGHTKKLPTLARISVPTAINAAGMVVGTADKNFVLQGHGFLVSGGVVTQFDPPGSTSTVPRDIAADGTIVGYYNGPGGTHGFIRSTAGTYSNVDVPGFTETEVFSINTAGELAGRYYDSGAGHYRGFTLSGANYITYQYPGAGDTEILRTLPSGLRIGNYTDGSSVVHGFSYLPDAYSTLDPAPGVAIQIRAVNNKGNFVGNTGQPLSGTAYLAICPPGSGVCLN